MLLSWMKHIEVLMENRFSLLKVPFKKQLGLGLRELLIFIVTRLMTFKPLETFQLMIFWEMRLHTYTIKDAIGDGNVLGFDITYFNPTIEIESLDEKHSEKDYEKEVYQSHIYREQVVQDILTHWDKTSSGALNAGKREKNVFQAMLAVSGKQAVVHYYNLFKEKAPHLRVAMTFSRDESNQPGTKEQNEALKKAIKEYSSCFNVPSLLNAQEPARAYMIDITKRLARKKPYNQGKDEDRLDLVIVSDQLLTGFDSKYINTIYMDKQ